MKKALLLLLALLLLTSYTFAQGYKITKGKLIGWTILAVAGGADGGNEAFDMDKRMFFVETFGADRYGYWGDQSWRSIYVGGNPANGYKSAFHRRMGAQDFYHHTDKLRRYSYVGGTAFLTISGTRHKQKISHTLLDIGIGLLVSGITKSITMNAMRLK